MSRVERVRGAAPQQERKPEQGGGGGDTRRSCSGDNQTLYCLSYIRRQHCENPVKNQGNSRLLEVVESL